MGSINHEWDHGDVLVCHGGCEVFMMLDLGQGPLELYTVRDGPPPLIRKSIIVLRNPYVRRHSAASRVQMSNSNNHCWNEAHRTEWLSTSPSSLVFGMPMTGHPEFRLARMLR